MHNKRAERACGIKITKSANFFECLPNVKHHLTSSLQQSYDIGAVFIFVFQTGLGKCRKCAQITQPVCEEAKTRSNDQEIKSQIGERGEQSQKEEAGRVTRGTSGYTGLT